MATYKTRGNAHNVIYTYKTQSGERKQQWETYPTELEAVQRKAYIDYLQRNKMQSELEAAAREYLQKRGICKPQETKKTETKIGQQASLTNRDNSEKTYREFAEKWLPFHARKERLSPNSYDCYRTLLDNHILPFFGERVMSEISSEDVDDFIDHLSRKPCAGSKSYHKSADEIPTLGSATVKKCYSVFMAGYPTAKKWKYVHEIPYTKSPAVKIKKRKAWEPKRVYSVNESMVDDKLLHLAVHIAFVCSLRAGETAGIDISKIDFQDKSFWITQEVQRVSDEALAVIPKQEIIRVFPKMKPNAKSSMILKGPKTEGSTRKQYLTTPLMLEIQERMQQIEEHKEILGPEYPDYGLLICQCNGKPIDPKALSKAFKKWQKDNDIKDQIEFQGLRKSGQMHKVRLSQNNYQLVAENSGQSPEVLMSNYNEALESEKRALSVMVENSFYAQAEGAQTEPSVQNTDIGNILCILQQNPALYQAVLQTAVQNAMDASCSMVANV